MKLWVRMTLLTVGMMLAFAGLASAHVVVYPKQAVQGSYEKFTVRVPTEKEVPTVKVAVVIPDEVNITRFAPIAGWSYEIERDGNDKITKVTWSAENEGLSATEFGEFDMQGRVADDAGAIVWKAYQTYGDGTEVAWIGAEGSDTPASSTTVIAKAASGTDSAADSSDSSGVLGWISLTVSIIALLVAVAALLRIRKHA